MSIRRFKENPIIHPGMSESIGDNINGPSLIRTPDWLPNRLGRYYLYFAHHSGKHIRLAYADRLEGPWRIHEPGVLHVEETPFVGHVASPDVHVDHKEKRIRMYYHGPEPEARRPACAHVFYEDYPFPKSQVTRVAISDDGLAFESMSEVLAPFYARAFDWQGYTYLATMPLAFYRSRDPLRGFEPGPVLFGFAVRHGAVRVNGSTLDVWFSRRGDEPECIMHTAVDISGDWSTWHAPEPTAVLLPEHDYEGADCPLERSVSGTIRKRVRQLRDPGIYEEDGRLYLIYSVAGESGLAFAEIC